jgi:hypothetical protein
MKAAGLLVVAAAAAFLALWNPAAAELNNDGDLFVSFNSGLKPTVLPRKERVPVAVRVAGDVWTEPVTSPPPQLRTITVEINRQGRIFDRGLPICNVKEIQPATERNARKVCGGAIVGKGSIVAQVSVPTQSLFEVKANLLVFNGPRKNGRKIILAQAYARKPPGAFVLVFSVTKQPGEFGTVMSTTLPPGTERWAYLTHFDMTLKRTYEFHGRERSYVSAACSAPAGFDTVVFPLARATYGFSDGRSLTTSVARSCHVAS